MQVDVSQTLAREDIIVFPNEGVHLEMKELMEHSYLRRQNASSKIVSAGFVDLTALHCYGESESTGIKSRGDRDSILLTGGQYGFNIVDISDN
ncbi:hypothetical protein KAR91_47885 [Candidatus Pacearchaeota archaeon]|nr:hypothetical protein [Candidatus Pacearchaeota archaeon]